MTTKKDAAGKGKERPSGTLSRRRFGQLAMVGLAGGALLRGDLLAAATAAPAREAPEQAPGQTNLSARAQAEIEEKLKRIFAEYGDRLSEAQKQRMRGIVSGHVRMLETVRAIPLENPDAPATVLKLATGPAPARRRPKRSRTRARARKSPRAGR